MPIKADCDSSIHHLIVVLAAAESARSVVPLAVWASVDRQQLLLDNTSRRALHQQLATSEQSSPPLRCRLWTTLSRHFGSVFKSHSHQHIKVTLDSFTRFPNCIQRVPHGEGKKNVLRRKIPPSLSFSFPAFCSIIDRKTEAQVFPHKHTHVDELHFRNNDDDNQLFRIIVIITENVFSR